MMMAYFQMAGRATHNVQQVRVNIVILKMREAAKPLVHLVL